MRVIDPRVTALVGAEPGDPAPRVPAPCGQARILLFDNGKLDPHYGAYHVLFDELARRIPAELPGASTTEWGIDLLDLGAHGVAQVRDTICGLGVDGVVLAICDWGVSQTTVLLAAELEAAGLPTVTIALGPGQLLARTTARATRPSLVLTAIDSPRWTPAERLLAEAKDALDVVIRRFGIDDVIGQTLVDRPNAPDGSGWLELPDATPDPTRAFTAYMRSDGLGDGFPLYPPSAGQVTEFLDAAALAPAAQVWPRVHPRTAPVTAREVAGLAVMAGCEPALAPVVFAAFRAMADPVYRLEQAGITTHPGGTLVLVSGPDSGRYGIASDRGSLGPNKFANAAAGRAVALSYSFLLDARPGVTDLTTQGSPAEYSYCCAEGLAASPWPALGTDLGFGSEETTVTVHKCEGPHNVLDSQSTDPDELLRTFASVMATLGGNNSYVRGSQTIVFLNPEHARLLADGGLTKADVRRRLFELARNDVAALDGRGLAPIVGEDATANGRVPIAECAEDILVVVTGGAGPNSQVAIPWGHARGVTVVIDLAQPWSGWQLFAKASGKAFTSPS
jgi:hypothetical protein